MQALTEFFVSFLVEATQLFIATLLERYPRVMSMLMHVGIGWVVATVAAVIAIPFTLDDATVRWSALAVFLAYQIMAFPWVLYGRVRPYAPKTDGDIDVRT